MSVMPNFILHEASSVQIFGIGNTSMIRSVMTFGRQDHLNNAAVSRHFPRTSVSHVAAIGEHWKISKKVATVACSVMTARTRYVVQRVRPGVVKMRRNRRRMIALDVVLAAAYRTGTMINPI